MSDPQNHTDDAPEVEAKGIDPDMPSTDDGPDETDNLGAEDGKGTPPTVPPTDAGGPDKGVLADDPRGD